MSVFVLLALGLAVVALGAVVVAARQVLLGVRRLSAATQRVDARLRPLLDELQAEVAVSATEAEALQERIGALQRSRRRRVRPIAGQVEPEPGDAAIN